MQEAALAYARTAQKTASPREMEAQLLLRAAARLQDVVEGATKNESEVLEALRFNRKLWTILLSAIVSNENPLPVNIKQNLANLGAFILKHSVQLEIEPRPERFPVLVSINREMAAGLRGAELESIPA